MAWEKAFQCSYRALPIEARDEYESKISLLENDGHDGLRDFTFQYFAQRISGCDVYIFSMIMCHIIEQRLAIFKVAVSDTPVADKRAEINNRILGTLPPPFEAKFFGGWGDDDGYLKWNTPVRGTLAFEPSRQFICDGPLNVVPLEVGFTSASTSYMHIVREGGLARWPYGSREILVAFGTPKLRQFTAQLFASRFWFFGGLEGPPPPKPAILNTEALERYAQLCGESRAAQCATVR